MAATLTEIALDLYGLQRQEFTAARNGRVRELTPTDAPLASQVAALRKPAPAAWLVNLLARQSADELDALLRLGEQMRSAQEQLDREDLRRIGGERRTLVAALIRRGAEAADGLGHPPTPNVLAEVEQTLLAGTTDAAAAAAVASGLLVKPLRAEGFGAVELAGAVAVPDPEPWHGASPRSGSATGKPSPVDLAGVRRRKEARLHADRLEREADTAAAENEALDRRAHRLVLRRASLEAEIVELRDQLNTAEAALRGVAADEETLAEARTSARVAAEESSRRARAARASADALGHSD